MFKRIKDKFFPQKTQPTDAETTERHAEEIEQDKPIDQKAITQFLDDEEETLKMLYTWLSSLKKKRKYQKQEGWIPIIDIADRLEASDKVVMNLILQLKDQHKCQIHVNGDSVKVF